MFDIDCVVVGAGVVGLAAARALARGGRSVLVAEAREAIGMGTSSRNSEVIHAGIYYPAGSLKARACVAGKEMLYAYCEARGVPFRRLGKLIVATAPGQLAALEGIAAHAAANGVTDLRHLSRDEARALEPELACEGALLSPSTGIVDSHGLMLALQGDAASDGAEFVFHTPVERATWTGQGFRVDFGGAEPVSLSCRVLVNAAGLHAPALASRIEGLPREHVPKAYWCKGSYASLIGRAPFSHLIYPVPEAAGLGVHLTLDLAGQARFGPDVEWIDGEDYTIGAAGPCASSFLERFDAAVRRYWPGLPAGALAPAYAGIRPKISGPGEPAADFVIDDAAVHGLPGLVNLFGIESPGLTSALWLGEEVARRVAADTR